MKKLINKPEDVVTEELQGIAAAHADLVRVQFNPNVIIRAAMPTMVPGTRVPSLRINVSADAIAASDTTHRLAAAATRILLICHFLLEGAIPLFRQKTDTIAGRFIPVECTAGA